MPVFKLIKPHGHGSHNSTAGITSLAYKPGHNGLITRLERVLNLATTSNQYYFSTMDVSRH
jgi:hypothetical protein